MKRSPAAAADEKPGRKGAGETLGTAGTAMARLRMEIASEETVEFRNQGDRVQGHESASAIAIERGRRDVV